jgi:hypothetical protein
LPVRDFLTASARVQIIEDKKPHPDQIEHCTSRLATAGLEETRYGSLRPLLAL